MGLRCAALPHTLICAAQCATSGISTTHTHTHAHSGMHQLFRVGLLGYGGVDVLFVFSNNVYVPEADPGAGTHWNSLKPTL